MVKGYKLFLTVQMQSICPSLIMFFFYHFRNYIGDQVEYISQNLDNIQSQLANHTMMLDNSLFYDVFGQEGVQVRMQGFFPIFAYLFLLFHCTIKKIYNWFMLKVIP